MKTFLLAGLVALSGCTFYIPDADRLGHEFAECHVGAFEPSFCVVNKTKDQAVVSGAGAVATFNSASGMVAEGVVLHGLVK